MMAGLFMKMLLNMHRFSIYLVNLLKRRGGGDNPLLSENYITANLGLYFKV
jgi:hypothetical protein